MVVNGSKAMGKNGIVSEVNHGTQAFNHRDCVNQLPVANEGGSKGGEEDETIQRSNRGRKESIRLFSKDGFRYFSVAIQQPALLLFIVHCH